MTSTKKRIASSIFEVGTSARIVPRLAPKIMDSPNLVDVAIPQISATPLQPVGAMLSGVDLLQNPLPQESSVALRGLLRQHGMLLLRGYAGATPEQLIGFAANFCNRASLLDPERCPQFNESSGGKTGFPMLRALGTESGSVLCRLGYEWHVDSSDLTFLYCVQAPVDGGETLFVSTGDMYSSLPEEKKEIANNLRVYYSNRYTGGGPAAVDCQHGLRMTSTGTRVLRSALTKKKGWMLNASPPMPAVINHNGRKALVLSPKNIEYCERRVLDGSWQPLNPEESRKLVEELMLPGLQPVHAATLDEDLSPIERSAFGATVLEHHWQPGDLVLWDNTAVLHSTTPPILYEGQPREMIQLMFSGELFKESGETMGFGAQMNGRAHSNER